MKVKAVEYLANILPDGHLSIPEEIRKKLKHTTKKRVKVSIEIETSREVNKKHPAIGLWGIWANRFSGGSSTEIAEELRHQIETGWYRYQPHYTAITSILSRKYE